MNKKWLYLIAGVVLAAAVLIVLPMLTEEEKPEVIVHDIDSTQASVSGEQSAEAPKLELLERRENEDMIELVTSYCTLSFPYAFSDLVTQSVTCTNERIAIDFYAALGGKNYPVYTVSFSGEGDIHLGSITVDDVTFEVSAKFFDEAAELEGDNLTSFHAARETFNDIWVSLESNENFTSEQ